MSKVSLSIFFGGLVLVSFFVGVQSLNLSDLLNGQAQAWFLFTTVRFPRTMSLVLAGATLSCCGLMMQRLTQNRFVGPTTAGTMASARLGILVAMVVFANSSALTRTGVAFLFGFAGTILFIQLTRVLPQQNAALIPLVGVMFSNILSGVATFFAYQLDLVQNMSSWLQGNFSTVTKGSYELIFLTLPLFLATYFLAHQLTVLGAGETLAQSVGLKVKAVRFWAMFFIALAVSAVLVMVGSVPFIGVVIPNFVSIFLGDRVEKNLLPTILAGASFLLLCDIVSRVVIFPYELPVSLMVSLIGAPAFIWLFLRRQKA